MTQPGDDPTNLLARWSSAQPFVIIGSVLITTGGIVAAITRPASFEAGSWVAAYLVLVGGVAQIALGVGQAWISGAVPTASLVWKQAVAWNLGGALVVAGTLITVPILTSVGGVMLAVALALFLVGLRETGPVPSWAVITYRGLAGFVLLSVPVGLVLAWLRH